MFLRSSFSPVSFSSISFNGAAVAPEEQARSGYWRLFFTQLQEESDKVANEVKSAEKTTPVVVAQVPTQKPVKKAQRAREETPAEEVTTVPPFRPLPMYEAKPDEPTYLQQMWTITAELRIMVASLQQQVVKFDNDAISTDEDDIELLLLIM